MAEALTKKEHGFVKDYLETGNGTQAALKNYDTEDPNTAGVIAHENLRKPKIARLIREALSEDLLIENHLKLFDQKRVDYFIFPKKMSDGEVISHVEAAGIEVITVREGEKGKMAFYSLPDAQAVKGALEMAYKIKGTFAPEKSINMNMEVEDSGMVRELTDKLNAIHRGTSISGDGESTGALGTETQNQE